MKTKTSLFWILGIFTIGMMLGWLAPQPAQAQGDAPLVWADAAPMSAERDCLAAAAPTRMGAFLSSSTAALYPPADHQGEDLILQDGAVIWGVHTGIGFFFIPSGAKVEVLPYAGESGLEPGAGGVEIHAQSIVILGELDASGAGYTGGAGSGGRGGEGYSTPYNGSNGVSRYGSFIIRGDGAASGYDGGYNVPGANTDKSTDTATLLGSGGWGGYGNVARGDYPTGCGGGWLQTGCPGTGGGGGGGAGGGSIQLAAQYSLSIEGQLLTAGKTGGDGVQGYEGSSVYINMFGPIGIGGSGGNGGNGGIPGDGLGGRAGYSTAYSQDGGAGAGGGILLYCEEPDGLTILGQLDARGGRNQMINGGTIKIRYRGKLDSRGEMFSPRVSLSNLDAYLSGGWMIE